MRTGRLLIGVLFIGWVTPASAAQEWSRTIEKVAPSIVSIQVDSVRAFDTEWNASAQATGFVVDAKRGIILTNRHVVTPGPVTARAIFRNHEVVDLKPIYRDPVHDFGFYQYDPAQLEYIKPQGIGLMPDHATVGREIRVIGNDAGERLSILAGTLARLDREAPEYGRGNYNDFNTFYIQAASGTSGGSSGSPVISIDDNAIALNAGGRSDAASSFYLPLNRVVRALEYLQKNQTPPRGTLQTTFVHTPFDELRRLGLSGDTERAVRKVRGDETGMLVVSMVQPGGAADGVLEPGDILVRVNKELVTRFPAYEAAVDSHVGGVLTLEVERGGQPIAFEITVGDLHAITPDEYLEFGNAVVHQLSYQQARNLYREQRGVYIANPGFLLSRSGFPRGAVITGINGEDVFTLDDFQQKIAALEQGERARIRFFDFAEPRRAMLAVLTMDWRWFPVNRCKRNDTNGLWDCIAVQGPAGIEHAPEPATASYPDYDDRRLDRIARSLVFVEFDMPYLVDGVGAPNYYGTGLVADAREGLVVVDRNTVPVSMGDARLTFAGSVEVPARVIYVHPLHNLAVLKYDPALLADTPVASAEIDTRRLRAGEEVVIAGFQPNQVLQSQGATVQNINPLNLPLSPSFQFRESNISAINLENAPDNDGVMLGSHGKVVALWSSFAFQSGRSLSSTYAGMPAEYVDEVIRLAKQGRDASLRSLETELYFMPLASARKLGLSQDWSAKLETVNPRERRVLAVERVVAGAPAEALLREGDLLLAIDGKPVADFRSVEKASQKDAVQLSILRDSEVQQVNVPTVALDGRDTGRLVAWAGAQLQNPHRAMAAQRGIPREGVLVSYFAYGSPASRYGLTPGRRILEVDGNAVENLDAFLAAVADRQDGDPVRLKTVLWDGRVEVITLKLDLHYWPTYEIRRSNGGWMRDDNAFAD